MIKFIKGYSLSDFAKNEPHCDAAIRTVNLIGDHPVLNEDVKPHSILIQKQGNFQNMRFSSSIPLSADFEEITSRKRIGSMRNGGRMRKDRQGT